MKVLYDISHLGIGHINHGGRTGIVRVIENVAMELATNPECDLTFCSNKDRVTLAHAVSYVKETKIFSKVPFSKPPFFDLELKSISKKDALIKIFNNSSPGLLKQLKLRFQIKELAAIEKFCKRYYNLPVYSRDIKKTDIYHSPFYPLPKWDFNGRHNRMFLTCYDLIPILFPHYFDPGIVELMKKILNSITPETWVLCISSSTRNDLLNYLGNKVNANRVLVTELAASEIFYKSNDKENNKLIRSKHKIPDVPYVLSLCTLEPRKNIDQVIRAYITLIEQQNIKDLYLVLVGTKGWLFEKIFEEIARNPSIKDKIIITGFVADEDLAALYSDALMFVYPSYYEGFGLPPLEAMKCGTPVITSNTSSLPEVMGNAGIMISPSDLDALCTAMLSVYKNPHLHQEMSIKSLERSSHFSWERCGRETVEAYTTSMLA